VLAAPVGSFLGDLIGWRDVFLLAAALGLLAMLAQWLSLPSMRPTGVTRLRTLVEVLVRPGIGPGMLAVLLVFGGHFVFFTYLRAYLESGSGFSIESISVILLGFGAANFLGTLLGGRLVQKKLRLALVLAPLAMGSIAAAMVLEGADPVADVVAVILWGLFFGGVPVAWSSWIARTVPDETESAGGLFVASISFAIALGAGLGGVVFDLTGGTATIAASGTVLALAVLSIMLGVRLRAPAVVAARPGIGPGMLAVLLVFGGHFVFFTYLRAYLESGSGFSIESISVILLGFGAANFLGTLLGGRLVQKKLRLALVLAPLAMGSLAAVMVLEGADPVADVIAVILWGLFFGGVPVAWSSWIARTVPDETETAGGLFVASISFAIALGAGLGGVVFDLTGGTATIAASGTILALAVLSIMLGVRMRAPAAVAA